MPSLSFIVPAYNEAALLGSTLNAIHEAARALDVPFEVIVVDDASTDATATIACRHGVRLVSVNARKISVTRNAGAREARGDWLIFVDADTLITEPILHGAIRALRAGAVGGGSIVHFEGQLPRYGRALIFVLAPLYGALGLAAGCFLFCTRDAFQTVGGFDESLFAAEEVVLSRSLGRLGRFVILRAAVTTSGRKLRAYTAREVLGTLARVALLGRPALRRREGLDLWYANGEVTETRDHTDKGIREWPSSCDHLSLLKALAIATAAGPPRSRGVDEGCRTDAERL
jgi:glycosyltransferase involved in cell wall biosynthesis